MNKTLSLTLSSINIILYLLMIALWLSIPDELWLCLSLTLFNLSLSLMLAFIHRQAVVIWIRSHWFKNFTSSLVSLFLFFCILGLINYLAYKTPIAWDLHFAKVNSLAAQTKQVLASLEGPVEVTLFANKEQGPAIRALVELYRLEKSDLMITQIDPEIRPDLVQKYGVTRDNTVVMEKNGRRELVQTFNELHLTNALIRLGRESDPVLCFSSGSNEEDLQGQEATGLSQFRDLLYKNSYKVEEVILPRLSELPEDCRALVILGPKLTLRKESLGVIQKFLEQGKGVFIALNPNLNEDHQPAMREWLKKWGVSLHNDLVIDKASHVSGSDGTIPLVNSFISKHPIVKNFSGVVFFPLTSSLELKGGIDLKMDPLVSTSSFPESWAERSVDSLIAGEVNYDESDDLPGPIILMAATESTQNQGRLVVSGNASMLANSYANYGMNGLLVLNALSWLVKEDRLIAFESAAIKDEPVFINAHQMGLIFYVSVIFLPLLFFSLAFYVYRRRSQL